MTGSDWASRFAVLEQPCIVASLQGATPVDRKQYVPQVLTGAAAALAMLYFLRAILVPFVIAFVLAVLVDALVRWIKRHWRGAPHWAVSVAAALVVIISASLSIFTVAQGMVNLASQGPAVVDRLEEIVQSIGRSLDLSQPLHLSTIVGKVNIPEVAGQLLSGLQGVASGVLLMIIYFGFMLAGQARIARKMAAVAGTSERADRLNAVLKKISTDIETYVWVQTVTGLMLTAAAVAVMMFVGLDNVVFWAVIFFLLTFIPNIGVTVGSIAPSLFALLQFQTVWQAIVVFVGIQVAAFIVGNLIYPRMQAESQNIDPVVTLLSLAFWTLMWGLAGSFLAVPMTLMLMMVFAQFDETRWVAVLLSNDGKPDFGTGRAPT